MLRNKTNENEYDLLVPAGFSSGTKAWAMKTSATGKYIVLLIWTYAYNQKKISKVIKEKA